MALQLVKVATENYGTTLTTDISVHISHGLPAMRILGMAATKTKALHDRLRTISKELQLPWPCTRIIIQADPHVNGLGQCADLGIWLALQQGLGIIEVPPTMVSIGRLGLEGQLRSTGALPLILAILAHGADTEVESLLVPAALATQIQEFASLCDNPPQIHAVNNVRQAMAVCRGATGYVVNCAQRRAVPIAGDADGGNSESAYTRAIQSLGDFAEVVGQEAAKGALELAAIGKHHCSIIGPPGSGKSMLVHRMPTIMPLLNATQALEVAVLTAQASNPSVELRWQVPLVAPHHSISRSALVGGGQHRLFPGAISLAHHGILFLDEAGEIPGGILDCLRTPLEQREIVLTRVGGAKRFPAAFQLILAANPCRCGASAAQKCSCNATQRRHYLQNISGPLRDRLDLHICTTQVGQLRQQTTVESSAKIQQRVCAAYERSYHRWKKGGFAAADCYNGAIPGSILRREYPATIQGMEFLDAYMQVGMISQRSADSILRIAWSICDQQSDNKPDLDAIAQAMECRGQLAGEPLELST
ncbi:MAG: ATP-binding protein [Corynebacterium sp.]|nr:ATP-binding protein [Corynebacterium sp.]